MYQFETKVLFKEEKVYNEVNYWDYWGTCNQTDEFSYKSVGNPALLYQIEYGYNRRIRNLYFRCWSYYLSHFSFHYVLGTAHWYLWKQHAWNINQFYARYSCTYHFVPQSNYQTILMQSLSVGYHVQMLENSFKFIDIFYFMIPIGMFT